MPEPFYRFRDTLQGYTLTGSLETCLQVYCSFNNLDYQLESIPGGLLDQIKADLEVKGSISFDKYELIRLSPPIEFTSTVGLNEEPYKYGLGAVTMIMIFSISLGLLICKYLT